MRPLASDRTKFAPIWRPAPMYPTSNSPLMGASKGKQHGTMRKTKHRGTARVAADFLLNLIAYNLIRIPKLIAV